jgi:hypothetical protein
MAFCQVLIHTLRVRLPKTPVVCSTDKQFKVELQLLLIKTHLFLMDKAAFQKREPVPMDLWAARMLLAVACLQPLRRAYLMDKLSHQTLPS